jgi:hypothetical protein
METLDVSIDKLSVKLTGIDKTNLFEQENLQNFIAWS